MSYSSVQKVYKLYEIFNDFNRIRILIYLNGEEKTLKEISKHTELNKTILLTQLEYLCNYKIVSQIKNQKTETYKIIDKSMIKIINDIIKYINK